jgi:hypothetical protein
MLTAHAAAQKFILYVLGLVLKNRRLLWGFFRIFCVEAVTSGGGENSYNLYIRI